MQAFQNQAGYEQGKVAACTEIASGALPSVTIDEDSLYTEALKWPVYPSIY